MATALALTTAWATAQVRRVTPEDLPTELRSLDLAAIHEATKRRVAEGERDHMIFYALQSKRFTALTPVEPALSARAFVESNAVPADAEARLKAFLETKPADARHIYFRTVATSSEDISREYRRAMRFLHEKEWKSRSKQGSERREYVAGLYETRGHSTDSGAAANYAVYAALSALREREPARRIRRVLIIGPGMEIAPRTALDDEHPPQSLQPYLTADTLIRVGLSRIDDLSIDCADVNPRVVRHIRGFTQSSRRLRIEAGEGDTEWNAFFRAAGNAIGRRLPGNWAEVSARAAARVTAFEMNVLTERPNSAQYDLVIATNVLLYCNREELGLAFANIAASLAPSGHLIHNDGRGAVEPWGRAMNLPVADARMVRLAAQPGRELYDSAILHTKQ